MAIRSALGLRHGPAWHESIVSFAVRWLILAVAVWVAAYLVPGIHWQGSESIALVALILGLLNALVRPRLFWVSFPLTLLTLGAILVLLNAVMLWLADRIGEHVSRIHFRIDNFLWDAIVGALIISVVGWLLSGLTGSGRGRLLR